MEHAYEYMTIVDFLSPIVIGGFLCLEKESERLPLFKSVEEFWSGMSSRISELPDNEGWEVNSHSLFLAGSTVGISVLLQRPRG